MPKEIITEGKAQIEVDTADIVSKDLEVFYNPDMVLNRDISIAVLRTQFDKPICIALPLAGTGVRGVRILKEIPELVKKIEMNDASPEATKLIKENLERNGLEENETIRISQKDACLFLEDSDGFDYIDIDPFGSPNQFLDTAIRKLSRKGILAVTATDTAALAGTYPTTCKRKYWSTSAITPHKHEMGLRILARKVMLLGIHHNKVLKPVLSYHYKHYYRIIFECIKSKEQAAKLLDSLQAFVNYDKVTADISVTKNPDESKTWCGPLYEGELHDKEFLEKLLTNYKHKVIEKAKEELNVVGSYDTHQVSQKNDLRLVPLDDIIRKLQEKKFEASRCATNLHAVKTTASFQKLIEVMKELNA
ncbi:MAG: hypothetical protein KC535_01585 [Nanoarchaeota archaeon]|nr:hypothetical protein [Nanoarchaeota archaeon]